MSDGTAAGTFTLVPTPQPPGSAWGLHSLFSFGSGVLFTGGPRGVSPYSLTLWRSDGTVAGTLPLGTAANGGEALFPLSFARLGDDVFFAGSQEATGRELWATDGTVDGTRLVADVIPGASSGLEWTVRGLGAAGDRLFFPADDGVHGVELWSSDGTAAGTSMVADLAPGALSSMSPLEQPTLPTEQSGRVLWRSSELDGGVVRGFDLATSELTALQKGADRPGSESYFVLQRYPTVVATPEGAAFFAGDAAHGDEPWASDGSPAGTRMVADVQPGPEGSVTPRGLLSLGDTLLMLATTYTGTVWQTRLLAAAGGSVIQLNDPAWSNPPTDLVAWDGAAWLTVDGGLWRSDGTVAGTAPVYSSPEGCSGPKPAADRLYFACGQRLFVAKGTPASIHEVAPGWGPRVDYSPVSTVAAGRFFFVGFDTSTGRELWVTDGTDLGTRRVVDLAPGSAGSVPTNTFDGFDDPPILAAAGELVFFVADDGGSGEELWVTDGTAGNATLLDLRPGSAGAEPRWLTAVGQQVYFVADDGTHGRELWVSDGSVAGTHIAADVRPGAESSAPRELTSWSGSLVFAADDGVHGQELWQVVAGGAGAQLVADLWPGAQPGSPQGLTPSGGKLFFFADDGVQGLEPWAWPAGAGLFSDDFETGATGRWTGGATPSS